MLDSLELLELALQRYEEGAYYGIRTVEEAPSVEGCWFYNWEGEKEPPSYEVLESIVGAMAESGELQTVDSALTGVLSMVSTQAFQKILDSVEKDSAPLVLAIVALIAIGVYLYVPSTMTGMLAQSAWARFVACAKNKREITLITEEDVREFNTRREALGLPSWLEITP